MTSHYLGLPALAALALLGSCSSNNSWTGVPEVPASSKNEIGYNVTADRATRAAAVYNSNNLPKQFYLSAWSLPSGNDPKAIGKPYITRDIIQDQGSGTAHNWVNETYPRYWPNGGETLNFFASTAPGAGFQDNVTNSPAYMIPFTVQPDAESQTDLLYAATYGQKKSGTNVSTQTVNLNFHHALSQVVFTATCPNNKIEVEIHSVSIGGLTPGGTFTVPASSGTASWTLNTSAAPAMYTALAEAKQGGDAIVGSTVTPLSSSAAQADQALMLVPQTVAAADPSKFTAGGAYLIVQCQIWNIADPTTPLDPVDDNQVFGIDDDGIFRPAALYLPINVSWEPGKRYVYNLNFGTGGGGYDKDGNQVLVKVGYNVNVDDWKEAGSNIAEPGA